MPSRRQIYLKLWDREYCVSAGAELEDRLLELSEKVEGLSDDGKKRSGKELGAVLSEEIDKILGGGASRDIFGEIPAPADACSVLEIIARAYLGYRKIVEGEL